MKWSGGYTSQLTNLLTSLVSDGSRNLSQSQLLIQLPPFLGLLPKLLISLSLLLIYFTNSSFISALHKNLFSASSYQPEETINLALLILPSQARFSLGFLLPHKHVSAWVYSIPHKHVSAWVFSPSSQARFSLGLISSHRSYQRNLSSHRSYQRNETRCQGSCT